MKIDFLLRILIVGLDLVGPAEKILNVSERIRFWSERYEYEGAEVAARGGG